MKAVMLSLRPQWCEKIFSGEKTIEVRRNRPKLEPPFTVYVYCTKAKNIREDGLYLLPNDKELYLGCKEKDLGFVCWEGDFRNGKVIGSFVCDKIEKIEFQAQCSSTLSERWTFNRIAKQACLTAVDMSAYLNGDNGYGWHITAPTLFDKPKELSEFFVPCKKYNDSELHCMRWDCEHYSFFPGANGDAEEECLCKRRKPLRHPPQSWCYVEGGNHE